MKYKYLKTRDKSEKAANQLAAKVDCSCGDCRCCEARMWLKKQESDKHIDKYSNPPHDNLNYVN